MPKLMPGYTGRLYRDGISIDAILALLETWRKDRGPALEQLREVRDIYNGDMVLPLPELDEDEMPAVPNLLSTGLDGHSQRIASTNPGVIFPATDDGNTKIARKNARMRRDVVLGWWDGSMLGLRKYRMARHYAGYGAFYLFIRPDTKLLAPKYLLRNPLNTYTASDIDEDLSVEEIIFTSQQTGKWIDENYPGLETDMAALAGDDWMRTTFEIVEYISCDEWVTLAKLGGDYFKQAPWLTSKMSGKAIQLDRIPNRIGVCPVVPGGRFGLDTILGQFTAMSGMFKTQGMLQALEIIATKRDIFPNVYLEGLPNQNPMVVKEADGVKGVIGKVMGGRLVNLAHPPGYQTNTTIDRIERNARTTGRIPSEFSGEAGTNIRTGRRGDSIISSTVDFGIQEAQTLFAAALRRANQIAIEVDLAYYGPRTKTYYLGGKNERARAESKYVPNDLWTTNRHDVTYSHPGSDTSQLTIAVLQLVGAEMISKRSGMEMHPMIDDAEHEHDLIQAEALEKAMMQALIQQAAQGAIPPADLARIAQLVSEDRAELAEAIQQVQEEAQKRQATPVPQGSPETQPGLAQPGAGAEQPTIPAPGQGSRNLLSLLTNSRLPQMPIGAEQGNASQISGIQPGFGAG